jgi:hypothetical protein
MTQMERIEGFRQVQRDGTRVAAVLRKVIYLLPASEASSPVQGDFSKSPSPSRFELASAPGDVEPGVPLGDSYHYEWD